MIVMAPPLSASFITMLVSLDNSLRPLCCCIGRFGFNAMWCDRNEIVVLDSGVIDK